MQVQMVILQVPIEDLQLIYAKKCIAGNLKTYKVLFKWNAICKLFTLETVKIATTSII